MNFFEGYSSIHIRDSSKRMNCGPFAWLSLMKKDRAMLVMWKQILNPNSTRLKNVMLLSGIYPKSVKSGNDSKKGTELRKSLSDETDTDRNTSTTSNHNLNYDPPISLPSASVSRNANIILNSIDINGHIKKKFKCSDPETRFREKALDRDGYNDIRPYDKLRRSNNIVNVDESESEHTKTKYEEGNRERIKPKNNVGDQEKHSANLTTDRTRIQKMNENTISLGLTLFEGKVDQELKLIEKLQVVLPERKVVWLLINKFFTDMYPYLPMIDEFDFKKEIARILGPRTSLNEIYLKVEKRLDFATLAILLIMLRFTYLSLFCNRSALNEQHLNSTDPSVRAQEIKFLMSNPISMDIIDMAQLCIDQFLLLQQSNLIVLQCLFFMRLYRKYAPEEGDGVDGGDSQIATGMLVQMGFLLGLNREPDAFKDVFNDERENNLSRKLWNLLVSTDLVQSFSFGNPLNIHTKYYDTKLPHYKIGNENISDAELEKHVLNDTILSGRFLRKIKELLDMTISISERVNLKELTDKLSEIEIKIHENLGELKDFLVPFDPAKYYAPFIKAESCKKLFLLKYFELSILMHIFLEYEKRSKRDLSFFYLRKLVSISCRELMPHYLNLIWDMHINFDTAAILALTPTIEETIHKTNQISFIVIIRLNVSIYQMKSDPNHDFLMANNLNYSSMFRQLCKLSCNMERCVEFCLSALDKLKSRYYYAWRVVKSHTFILKKMYEEDIYKTLDADEFQFLSISLPEIEELIQITEIPVSKYKKTKMYRDQEEKRNYEKMDEIRRKQTFDETGDATGDSKPPSENYRHLLYTLNQESTQMSESLTSISDFDEGVDNVAIDTLWYQLASKKNHGDNNKNNIIATNNNSENQNVNNLNNTNDVNQNGQYMDQPTNVTGNQFVESNFDQFGPNEATTDGIEYQQLGSFGTTPHPLEDPAQFMWDLDLYPIDLFDFQSISNQVP